MEKKTYYVTLSRVDLDDWFIYVTTEDETHVGIISDADALALAEQVRRGKTESFTFTDENDVEVTLPLDFSARLWLNTAQSTMIQHKKRLATPQVSLSEVYNG